MYEKRQEKPEKTNTTPKRTELSALGEFGLIDHLTKDLKLVNESTLKGVGDDAAVLDAGNRLVLVSTDQLVEGVHFDLTYIPLKHLGYKAAVSNFSDIAAMNALPSQITTSLAVSNRFPLEAIEELYNGIRLACSHYNVDVVGGDTTSSQMGMFLSITVIGFADNEQIVYRGGAQENDLLCVSGDLGAAYMGLLLLKREKEVFKANPEMQPDLEGHDYVLERQLKPEARTDIVTLLKNIGIKPTSMIDISDGLASEIMHLCKNSGTGCMLYDEKIPIDPATAMVAYEFHMDPSVSALHGGEDYELLFTIAPADYGKIKDSREITVIGHMTDKGSGINLIQRSGNMLPLTAQGWDAFTKRP